MMSWDGIERRRNFRCESHEQIAVDMGIIKTELINNGKKTDTIVNEITKMNGRCMEHIGSNALFTQHIEDTKKQKSIWSDRKFQIIILITGFAWAMFFFYFQRLTANVNGKYRTDRNIEANK